MDLVREREREWPSWRSWCFEQYHCRGREWREIKDFKVQKEWKLRLWLFVFLVNCLLSHILHMRVRWIRKICCVIQRIKRVRKLKAILSIHCIYWFGFKIGKIRLLNYRMREGIWPLLFGLALRICLILRISAKWAKLLWS